MHPRPARRPPGLPARAVLPGHHQPRRLRRPQPGGEHGLGRPLGRPPGRRADARGDALAPAAHRQRPYFVLGNDRAKGTAVRYRVASPWDWRARYELCAFEVAAAVAGQPRVDWRGAYRDRRDGTERAVAGHVEVRWSHGRFAGPPEAKVYLDTPMSRVPGYHRLVGIDEPQLQLFPAEP